MTQISHSLETIDNFKKQVLANFFDQDGKQKNFGKNEKKIKSLKLTAENKKLSSIINY